MKSVIRTVAIGMAAVATAFLASSAVVSADDNPSGGDDPRGPDSGDFVEVLIGFFDDPDDLVEDIRELGGTVKYVYHLVPAIAASLPVSALDEIESDALVNVVEPDVEIRAVDAELDNTWGVKRIGAGTAHDGGNRGTGVRVAVIDSGIDCTHPDLAARCAGGFDFVNNDNDPTDDNGHGTHVAGTIAAEDNATGVVGAAPEVSIYALKVLSANGSGSFSDVIAALEWAVLRRIQVTNNSYGSSGDPGAIVKAAFDAAEAAGLVNVGAAGNEGTCAGTGDNVIYPARWSSVIAVAATTIGDGVPCFSSTGPDVELAAPGVGINSTLPGGAYGLSNGTSMASPHVAGTSALVIASGIADTNENGRINDEVRLRMQLTAEDLGLPATWTGNGLVDAAAAVAGGTPTNAAPTANAGLDQSGDEGGTFSFDGSGSSDTDGTIVSYDWDFGDGVTASGVTPSHSYADDSVYTVTLTVTDDDGATGSDTALVTVDNVAPTAASGGPYAGVEGDPITFTGTVADPGSVDTHTFAWTFGDGASASGQTVTHAYTDNGSHTVILTVTDDDGGGGTDATTATVSNAAPTAFAGGPYSGPTGSPITFTGGVSDPGSADSHSFAWDFGDGATAAGQTVSHTYVAAGPYVATLTVTDDDGGAGSDTAAVTVTPPNAAPAADAGLDQFGNEGGTFSFDGSGSSDADGTIVSYDWDFGDGGTASGVTPTHLYVDDGVYTVTLTVTDDDGAIGSDTAVVTVDNVAPTAATGGPYAGVEGDPITFTGTVADPGPADTHTFAWTFGDGASGTGQTVAHAYADDGSYTVILTVTDDDGGGGTDATTATVANAAPTAFAGGPYSGPTGSPITFTGGVSDPGSADSHSFAWDFGDGATAAGQTVSHTYLAAGPYVATLAVTDDDGATGTDTAAVTVTPTNAAPTANAGLDQSGDEGATFSFDGSGSSDADGTIVSYDWDFGDGGTASGVTPTHLYVDDGVYTVTLTVTDEDGAIGSDTAVVTVDNVAPVAAAGGPYSATAGDPVTLTGGVTDPGLSDTHSFAWDFGDGTTGTGQTVSHTYVAAGPYVATLTVTDDDGGAGSDTATVTVNTPNASPTVAITSPSGGDIFLTIDSIPFSGTASDPEDGTLTAGLVWTSDIDGAIGGGGSFSAALSIGNHTITASVTDSGGASASESISITVNSPVVSDTVEIIKAKYESKKSKLRIEATSTEGGSVILTATAYDADNNVVGSVEMTYNAKKDRYKGDIKGLGSKPAKLVVESSGGGSATRLGDEITSKSK